MNEHEKILEKREILKSNLCFHSIEHNHKVHWGQTKILYKEKKFEKEMSN